MDKEERLIKALDNQTEANRKLGEAIVIVREAYTDQMTAYEELIQALLNYFNLNEKNETD